MFVLNKVLLFISKPGISHKKVFKQFDKGFLQGIIYNWLLAAVRGLLNIQLF